jgi:hypothetical protein
MNSALRANSLTSGLKKSKERNSKDINSWRVMAAEHGKWHMRILLPL